MSNSDVDIAVGSDSIIYTLETFTGMGTAGITWNPRESHRDGSKVVGFCGEKTNAAGLPWGM